MTSRLYIYTERREDMGSKNVTVSAYFASYPTIRSEDVFLSFDILDEPCAFE
jgi:hypothetical protein